MLVVEFESGQYTGSESSGFVEVVVMISGGSSTTPISVMLITIERTATGAGEIHTLRSVYQFIDDNYSMLS